MMDPRRSRLSNPDRPAWFSSAWFSSAWFPSSGLGTDRRRSQAGAWEPGRKSRDGFSILEVILALAILAGSIAVLGEIASLGLRNAQAAGNLTHAQLLCEGKLAEITAGITAPDPVRDVQFELPVGNGKVGWVYSIDVMDVDEDGLVAVCVTVRQDIPPNKRPVSCSLIRWILDPEIELSELAEEEE